MIAVVVPASGFATAKSLHVLGSTWLITSIALTALAAVVLGGLVLPRQEATSDALDAPAGPPESAVRTSRQLALYTGVFNLLWATVTVLMIIRPGSTTGA
ncbi:hypothetical protein GCM10020254_09540 [Streptomyces goshikiensis]